MEFPCDEQEKYARYWIKPDFEDPLSCVNNAADTRLIKSGDTSAHTHIHSRTKEVLIDIRSDQRTWYRRAY